MKNNSDKTSEYTNNMDGPMDGPKDGPKDGPMDGPKKIPSEVKSIIDTIEAAGYEAYAVGGCVRDLLINTVPDDWDITTSAKPEEIKRLFRRTIDTGLEHGTVTIMIEDTGYEVTTYRIDGAYNDYRRPEGVHFTNELLEDLKRRDFTINAMAYNSSKGIIDAFDGIKDLKEGIIRCVGSPKERFNEDALRMLRAIRFAARFGFDIEAETVLAIKENAHLIKNISVERIQVELTKTLTSDHPEYIDLLHRFGLLTYVMPEYEAIVGVTQENPHHIFTVDQHTIEAMKHIRPIKVLRWTMLCHDLGKAYTKTIDEDGVAHFYNHVIKSIELARGIFNRLKFDNDTKHKCLKLIEYHDYRIPAEMKAVRKLLAYIGEDLFHDYIEVRKADILAQNPEYLEEQLVNLDDIVTCYNQVIAENQCFQIKDLAISGHDLLELGLKQGKEIGITLKILLNEIIEEPELNTKAYLISRAVTLMGENS